MIKTTNIFLRRSFLICPLVWELRSPWSSDILRRKKENVIPLLIPSEIWQLTAVLEFWCFCPSPACLLLSSPHLKSTVVPSHWPSVKSFSGLNPMKIQAKPTSSATTRLIVTHGFRIWCSEPAGLQKKKRDPEQSSAAGSPWRPDGSRGGLTTALRWRSGTG